MTIRTRAPWILVTFALGTLAFLFIFANFMPPPISVIENDFYSLRLSSSIIELRTVGSNLVADFGIFQLEENYRMDWKLETPTDVYRVSRGLNHSIVTMSDLYTYTCFKDWRFSNSPLIQLRLIKIYEMDAWSLNNQIIVDVFNGGISTDNSTYVYFDHVGFGFVIVDSNEPVEIQIPTNRSSYGRKYAYPTEVQINFNGARDRDPVYHCKGEMEEVVFLIYANKNGTLIDFLELCT